MTAAYKERHDYIVAELQKMSGIKCLQGDGTFYCFPSVENIMKDDIEFSEYLLNEAEIAVVPGSAFGTPGFIRISYATSMKDLQEAVKRMQEALRKL